MINPNDPSIHNWVKEQYKALLQRDPVDAIADVELLRDLLLEKYPELDVDGDIQEAVNAVRTHLNMLKDPVMQEVMSRLGYQDVPGPLSTQGVCDRCDHNYDATWYAPHHIWKRVRGDKEGMLCILCFNDLATEAGMSLRWTCEDLSEEVK